MIQSCPGIHEFSKEFCYLRTLDHSRHVFSFLSCDPVLGLSLSTYKRLTRWDRFLVLETLISKDRTAHSTVLYHVWWTRSHTSSPIPCLPNVCAIFSTSLHSMEALENQASICQSERELPTAWHFWALTYTSLTRWTAHVCEGERDRPAVRPKEHLQINSGTATQRSLRLCAGVS